MKLVEQIETVFDVTTIKNYRMIPEERREEIENIIDGHNKPKNAKLPKDYFLEMMKLLKKSAPFLQAFHAEVKDYVNDEETTFYWTYPDGNFEDTGWYQELMRFEMVAKELADIANNIGSVEKTCKKIIMMVDGEII